MKLDAVTFARLRRLARFSMTYSMREKSSTQTSRGPSFACTAMLTAVRRIPLPASRRDAQVRLDALESQ